MKLIFLGAPGVGKGTYAGALARNYNFIHISTGEILRAETKKDTLLGREVAKIINSGNLVSDKIINDVLTSNLDSDKNYILDGYPRTLTQGEFLDEFLFNKDDKIDYVMLFELPYEQIMKRITGRRRCGMCGKDYNVYFMPPKKDPLKCDDCNGNLLQRKDDTEEVLRHRLKVFEQDTMPLIEYYENKNLLHRIDASSDIEVVIDDVVNILKLKVQ